MEQVKNVTHSKILRNLVLGFVPIRKNEKEGEIRVMKVTNISKILENSD